MCFDYVVVIVIINTIKLSGEEVIDGGQFKKLMIIKKGKTPLFISQAGALDCFPTGFSVPLCCPLYSIHLFSD